jgi:hypothetical protein
MQAILWDRVSIAKIVNVQVISLEEARPAIGISTREPLRNSFGDPHEELRKAA